MTESDKFVDIFDNKTDITPFSLGPNFTSSLMQMHQPTMFVVKGPIHFHQQNYALLFSCTLLEVTPHF